jgi:hypothetical protein
VVTASWDKTARLWDAATGKPLSPALEHWDVSRAPRSSPDGTRVVTASSSQVRTAIEARFIQLAGPAMRSYLATRVELSSEDIAVAIIDEADRFFFVVARGIAFTRRP